VRSLGNGYKDSPGLVANGEPSDLKTDTDTHGDMSSASSNSADTGPVSVGSPFSVAPIRADSTTDEAAGSLDTARSRSGDGRRRFYIHVPSAWPCDAHWHLPPASPDSEDLLPYVPTTERTRADKPSLDTRLPSHAQECLDHLTSAFRHERAPAGSRRYAVQLCAPAPTESARPPSLMTVAVSCSQSMVELLHALRVNQARAEGSVPHDWDMDDRDDLQTTTLSIHQVEELYPAPTKKLRQAHCAVFGTFEPADGETRRHFVRSSAGEPHVFGDVVQESVERGDPPLIQGFDIWLGGALAKADQSQ